MPTWLWAQTYENNVVGAIIDSPGVYPTPLYEAITAFFIFAFLWSIRTSCPKKGFMFSSYLILSGYSRLRIEKIRVNSEYTIWHIQFTQAEFISFVLILIGVAGILITSSFRYATKLIFAVTVMGVLSACTKI